MTPIQAHNVQLIFPAAPAIFASAAAMDLGAPSAAAASPAAAIPISAAIKEGMSPEVLALNLKEFMEYFKGFQIEQIELWISGAMETKGLLKLAIAAKGEGGVKVVLRPPKL